VLYTGLIEMQNHPVPTSRSGLLLNPNPGFLCFEGRPLGLSWGLSDCQTTHGPILEGS